MRAFKAFTLLEVLIALSLSSFIMIGIVQVHRGVMRYLDVTRQTATMNRKVCLVFNQLERDLNTAFIPFPYPPVPEKKADGASDTSQEDPAKKKEEEQKREEQRKSYFIARTNENADMVRINNKKLMPCSSISFICTNPFQVYGQKRQCLVRVIYELIPDKMKRSENFQTYQLVRKETFNLANVKGHIDEFSIPAPGKDVRRYVVLDGVKGLYLQYSVRVKDLRKKDEDKKKEEEKPKPDAPKNYVSQLWGDHFEVQGIVPCDVEIWLDMWNDDRTRSLRFQALFSVMSYPTEDEDALRKQQKSDVKQEPQAGPPPPGQPPFAGPQQQQWGGQPPVSGMGI